MSLTERLGMQIQIMSKTPLQYLHMALTAKATVRTGKCMQSSQ
jgi:hypothetical protein